MSTSSALAPAFLGSPIELCLVTADHKRTLRSLSALGIGPWRIYTCSPANTLNQTHQGRPSPFTLKFCYASLPPSNITFEVIEPVSGPTIFQAFLKEKGEGIHHVAFDCTGIDIVERVRAFEERGWRCTQSGTWCVGGENSFAFFEKEGEAMCVETIAFQKDWDWPEPEEWFPPEAGEARAKGVNEEDS